MSNGENNNQTDAWSHFFLCVQDPLIKQPQSCKEQTVHNPNQPMKHTRAN